VDDGNRSPVLLVHVPVISGASSSGLESGIILIVALLAQLRRTRSVPRSLAGGEEHAENPQQLAKHQATSVKWNSKYLISLE
jgi:hypothetical protein